MNMLIPRLIMRRSFQSSRRLNRLVPFKLADIGEGITEVELIQWHVKEGAEVKQFDRIAEVQSDKANVEITSRFDGIIRKLYHDVGSVAKVGAPLVDIEVDNGGGEEEEEAPLNSNLAEVLDPVQAAEELRDEVSDEVSSVLSARSPTTVKALPSVRRKAKELGVDLATIQPTGKQGQITLEDILLHGASKSKQTENMNVTKVVPLSMFQKAMVRSMTESIKIPHFGFNDEIALDRLLQVRTELQSQAQQKKTKLTPLPFLIKALSKALAEFPQLCGTFNPTKAELILQSHHNIGIAIDTPHGLALPVIKNVASQSVFQIAQEITRLTELARLNKLAPSELTGATMTISNIGTVGGTTASPIIPSPQLSIVALGRAQLIPRFDQTGKVIPVTLMPISWSADHRVVDGATIARFSQLWKHYIESPSLLLI